MSDSWRGKGFDADQQEISEPKSTRQIRVVKTRWRVRAWDSSRYGELYIKDVKLEINSTGRGLLDGRGDGAGG